MDALNIGYYLTSFLAAIGFAGASWWMLRSEQAPNAWIYYTTCGFIGILTAQAFVYVTQYYTEYKYRPVLSIAEASKTGPATNIISGIAVGLECTAIPIIVIAIAILSSYKLGVAALGPAAGITGGLFGTAVATIPVRGSVRVALRAYFGAGPGRVLVRPAAIKLLALLLDLRANLLLVGQWRGHGHLGSPGVQCLRA